MSRGRATFDTTDDTFDAPSLATFDATLAATLHATFSATSLATGVPDHPTTDHIRALLERAKESAR